MNDVVVNKVQSIQRCVQRAREEFELAGDSFDTDLSRQDAAILNITRACEQAIDLANHLLRRYKMGIPSISAESFELLARKSVINSDLAEKLQRMVGYRNIAVHQYQKLNIEITRKILKRGLDDLVLFTDMVVEFVAKR